MLKKLKFFWGYILALLVGFILTLVLAFEKSCNEGTTKGTAYYLSEEDISFNRMLGKVCVGIGIILFLGVEIFLKKKIFKKEKFLFALNIFIIFIQIIILFPYFEK